jgi:hypothetical protein
MFQLDDADRLAERLDLYPIPMFAADRSPGSEWRLQCVNGQHTKLSGVATTDVRNARISDLLPPQEAAEVKARYDACIAPGDVIHYSETLHINGRKLMWRTTLQPVRLDSGIDRVVGTALTFEPRPPCAAAGDPAYFAAVAQMQLAKVRAFLDSLENRSDIPLDTRQKAIMITGLMRSLDHVMDDMRRSLPRTDHLPPPPDMFPERTISALLA